MLDGGGGGGGTAWESMSMEQMRVLIQNPDVAKQYELLTGWQRSADLINEHRSQVMNYRDNLAAAWPPEKSAAAHAYVEELNKMIENLDQTYEASVSNHTAFAEATLSISLAQKEFETIYQEHSANEHALATFTASQSQPSATPTPSPSPSGEEPPVAPGRQEELRQKAALRLSQVSTELAQAQFKISTPPPFKPGGTVDRESPLENGGVTPPPIPPITPAPVFSGTSTSSSSRPSTIFPTNGNTFPGNTPPAPPPGAGANQPGPVLGGTNPPALTPPSNITPIGPTPPGGLGGPINGPGILPPTSNSFLPGGGSGSTFIPPSTPGAGRGVGLPREGLLRPGSPAGGGMHVMPPGGMIGGTPGVGLGQPVRSATGAQRINPVGGVIGSERGASAARGINSARGMGGSEHAGGYGTQFGQSSGRRGSKRDQATDNAWDPDNPWETAEGVAPVVLPPRVQRIDPGPAIGLS